MTRNSRFAAGVPLLLAVAACGGGHGAPKSEGGIIDAACMAEDGGANRANGAACGCAGDCQSGFCVDGICCNSACTDTCKTCNDQSAPGICSFVPKGVPAPAGQCAPSLVGMCGLDGTCDGQGHCRKYPAGTVCDPGACDGASVSDVNVCDGDGRCKSGPATICVPYNCDTTTNKCATTCATNADCASGILCVNGSCGLKPNGAVCGKDGDCKSNFCADGVCCNVACKGPCVSCNQQGRLGTCWPADVGASDPHGACVVQAPATCGTTGACDGVGGCARFASQTVCVAPACSGDRLNTAGTCDGLGSCRPPGMQNCSPYHCVNGACINKCTSNADCISGHVCQNGSCGPKSNGQPCAAASECGSNHCIDSVCCDQACSGGCRSCALQGMLGTCTPVEDGGDDPRNTCAIQAASTCGTDGKCDGAGGCRHYKPGTVCAAERCDNNVYTPEATCKATGACVAPDSLSCVPYACNGGKCFGSCTADANCSAGNFCVVNSCGPKPNGAFCSDRTECASGNCAQGVCCATACASSCKSCALSGTMGACTNVPSGSPDPAQTCVDKPGTCNTNGKCAAGACQLYAQGTPCGAAASCPSTGITLTPASACDGAGVCVTPPPSSCFPFTCGVGACKSTCAVDADCASPYVCNGGSCGPRPIGASCAAPGDCGSGFCAQGVCCASACTGSCLSCALTGTLGTCKPVAAGGTDPKGQCSVEGAATCGMTGLCDGAGACQLYAAGTQCAPPSCPTNSTTATLARTCDGAGTCRPATTQSCGAYACNGTTCNAACGANGDCAPGNVCNGGACGLKRLGQLCSGGSECDSGNCTDGVCCATGPCGNCQSCNVAGLPGMYQPVPADEMEPHGGCAPNPPCGFTGKCDGNSACKNAPATTSCGAAMCSGSTFMPAGNCNGAGACVQPSMSCGAYACGATSCRTMCSGDGDCAGGTTCMSNVCTSLKANGATCAAGADCFSGNCTEGFCCKDASCGSCATCALAGQQGTCKPVPAGGTDPAGVCLNMAVSTCGTTGVCDGAGSCATYAAGTTCMPSTCAASTLTVYTCGAGNQCTAHLTDCTPFACDGSSACKASCADPSDCATGSVCNAPSCQ